MITVISGPMKAGKSEEILRISKLSKIANRRVQLFKPDIDRRFDEGRIVSRDDRSEECIRIPADNADYILGCLEPDVKVVIIDEAQFFRKAPKKLIEDEVNTDDHERYSLVDVVQKLSDKGLHVVISGLDMDSDRKPFGPMPYLLAIADVIVKLKAVCDIDYHPAMYSYSKFSKAAQVVVGDKEYLSLCRDCYLKLTSGLYKLSESFDENGQVTKREIVEV